MIVRFRRSYIGDMSTGRVLVLIQVGGFADGAADAAPSPARWRARAPRQAHALQRDPKMKRKTKARGGGAAPLNRLGAGIRLSRRAVFSFFKTVPMPFEFQLLLGIRAMVSWLTVPINSPSFQQRNVSDSKSFLSSKPNGQMTSSSIISEIKNCGNPLE